MAISSMMYTHKCNKQTYGFLHRETETEAKFLELHLEDGNCLKLTPNHMLYKANEDCQGTSVVPAYRISTGDSVFVVSSSAMDPQKVSSITEVTQKGIYAPVTFGGNLLLLMEFWFHVMQNMITWIVKKLLMLFWLL